MISLSSSASCLSYSSGEVKRCTLVSRCEKEIIKLSRFFHRLHGVVRTCPSGESSEALSTATAQWGERDHVRATCTSVNVTRNSLIDASQCLQVGKVNLIIALKGDYFSYQRDAIVEAIDFKSREEITFILDESIKSVTLVLVNVTIIFCVICKVTSKVCDQIHHCSLSTCTVNGK